MYTIYNINIHIYIQLHYTTLPYPTLPYTTPLYVTPPDECDISADCSLHGLCVNTNSTFYPKKQCYCDAGWFGDQCQQSTCSSHT